MWFPLSLSEWFFTICPTPYSSKYNVLSASLNKAFPSTLPSSLADNLLTAPSVTVIRMFPGAQHERVGISVE